MVQLVPATANSAAWELPRKCTAAIESALPGWQLSKAPADAARWAKARRLNPVVTRGDFDGNGARDYAALVVAQGTTQLAVCMNPGGRSKTRLLIVEKPYCSDLVYRSKAKSKHHNFETGRDELIRHDGVSVACFEKAGATYVYERNRLREIVDSD